ncbi:hypothetical protein MKX01_006143 [Papaver californicum]|nr:hypothetical protein MKX01_006143 [Papaver californicum]
MGFYAAASVFGNHNKLEINVKEEQNQPHSNGIKKQQASIEIIDLDGDDDDDGDACGNLILDNPESSIWYYLDPSDTVQGPFSMTKLKLWKSRDYFESGFRVWKTCQTKEASILLTDAISQVFPSR